MMLIMVVSPRSPVLLPLKGRARKEEGAIGGVGGLPACRLSLSWGLPCAFSLPCALWMGVGDRERSR